jgi:hypothetical protein
VLKVEIIFSLILGLVVYPLVHALLTFLLGAADTAFYCAYQLKCFVEEHNTEEEDK